MRYLLDTNILLLYIRDNFYRRLIDDNFAPLGSENIPVISVVSIGEIYSVALRNGWGEKKYKQLEEILNQLVIADINAEDIIQRYAEIDAFSQGKLKDKPLGMTSRNMGKNDLWIAATASIIKAPLMTTDSDFDHLNNAFLSVLKIELKKV